LYTEEKYNTQAHHWKTHCNRSTEPVTTSFQQQNSRGARIQWLL